MTTYRWHHLKKVFFVFAFIYVGSVLYVGTRFSDWITRYDAALQVASDKVDARYRTTPASRFAIEHFNSCRIITRSGGGFRMATTYHQKSETECANATYTEAKNQGNGFAEEVRLVLMRRSAEQVSVPDSDVYMVELQRLERILDFLMLRW